MAGNIVTISIDDAVVRVMVTRGKRIIKLAGMPLDEGLSDTLGPEAEQALAAKIRLLFESNRINERKVILGLSGLHCLTRMAVLPVLPRAMVQEAVVREARRVLPVPPEQLYLSWQIISSTEESQSVFIVGIPRAHADALMRVIEGAGLKPILMDIKPLALARLASKPTCIVVDVQPGEFDLEIMAGGLPHPVRTVSFADDGMTMREKAEIVGGELERTVQFYNSNNPDNVLPDNTTIYFSGDITDEPELYENLAAKANYHAELLISSLKSAGQLDTSQYMVNAGLTLKKYPRDNVPLLTDLNTLPEPYLPKQLSMKKIMLIPAVALAAALIIFMVMNSQAAATRLQTTEAALDMTNVLLEKRMKDAREMTSAVAELQEQVAVIDNILAGSSVVLHEIEASGEYVNGDLEAVRECLFQGIQLTGINHIKSRVALSGMASSEQAVIKYVRAMTDSGRFSEITIDQISHEEAFVRFEILVNTEGR